MGVLNFVPYFKTALTGSTSFFASTIVFNAAMLAGTAAKSISNKFKKEYLIYAIILLIFIDLFPGINAFTYGWVNQTDGNYINEPPIVDAWNFVKNQEGNFVVLSTIGKSGEMYHGKYEFGSSWTGCPQCVDSEVYSTFSEMEKNVTKRVA